MAKYADRARSVQCTQTCMHGGIQIGIEEGVATPTAEDRNPTPREANPTAEDRPQRREWLPPQRKTATQSHESALKTVGGSGYPHSGRPPTTRVLFCEGTPRCVCDCASVCLEFARSPSRNKSPQRALEREVPAPPFMRHPATLERLRHCQAPR